MSGRRRAFCRPRTCCAPAPWPRPGTSTPAPATCRCGSAPKARLMLYDILIAPFADFGFMRRALVASLALSIGGSSIGVFLILRRMSLMGDALSHALLPGAALGFLLGGLSLPAMSLGGFLAGMATALISGVIARFTSMREDASFAAAYLTAMALGVLI